MIVHQRNRRVKYDHKFNLLSALLLFVFFVARVVDHRRAFPKDYRDHPPPHDLLTPAVNASLNAPLNATRRIAILSYNDGSNANADPKSEGVDLSNRTLRALVRCNHARYAEKHGYTYISPELGTSRWVAARFVLNGLRYKTFAILTYFDDYDVIVWIDHDAIFHDFDLSVEHWLDDEMRADADIMMAEDLPGYKFNAGVQIIKTTAWSRRFYETAVDQILLTNLNATYLEQPIFYRLHDLLDRERRKIHVYTPRWRFQAFLKVGGELKRNSWIAHATQSGRDLGELVNRDRDACVISP